MGYITVRNLAREAKANRKSKAGQERHDALCSRVERAMEEKCFDRVETEVGLYHGEELKTRIDVAGLRFEEGRVSVYGLEVKNNLDGAHRTAFETPMDYNLMKALKFFRLLDPNRHKYFLGGKRKDYRQRMRWVITEIESSRTEAGNLVKPVTLWTPVRREGRVVEGTRDELIYRAPFMGEPGYFANGEDEERVVNF